MKTVIFYLGMAALGYLLAVPLRNKKELFHPIGTVLKVVVTALVFVMGFRIAASEEIMANIAMIGVNSLLMAVGSLILTIGALYATRRLMGFDRFGCMTKCSVQNAAHDDTVTSTEKVPFWKTSPFRLGTAVALGTIVGYLTGIVWNMYDYDAMYRVTGIFVTYALYFMVFLVGVDIGSDEKAMRSLKDAGLRVLTFPIVTSAVTVSFIIDLEAEIQDLSTSLHIFYIKHSLPMPCKIHKAMYVKWMSSFMVMSALRTNIKKRGKIKPTSLS